MNITKSHIKQSIAVGLRKGVYSKEASMLYSALNPLFFNIDPKISEIGDIYVENLAEAAFIALQNNEDPVIAMKAASLDRIEIKDAPLTLTPENQGLKCLKSMLPLFENSVHKIDLDKDGIYNFYDYDIKNDWELRGYVGKSEMWIAVAVLLKLAEEIPEVKEKFAPYLVSDIPTLCNALYNASLNMQDDDWVSLWSWIEYAA